MTAGARELRIGGGPAQATSSRFRSRNTGGTRVLARPEVRTRRLSGSISPSARRAPLYTVAQTHNQQAHAAAMAPGRRKATEESKQKEVELASKDE